MIIILFYILFFISFLLSKIFKNRKKLDKIEKKRNSEIFLITAMSSKY